MSVRYSSDLSDFDGLRTEGFFEGWPQPPNEAALKRIMRGSSHVVLAIEGDRLVGFCTAVSDGVLASFIPLIEVLPEHRRKGVGSTLMKRMIEELSPIYAIDLVCDPDVVPFYERCNMVRTTAMSRRDYRVQSGVR